MLITGRPISRMPRQLEHHTPLFQAPLMPTLASRHLHTYSPRLTIKDNHLPFPSWLIPSCSPVVWFSMLSSYLLGQGGNSAGLSCRHTTCQRTHQRRQSRSLSHPQGLKYDIVNDVAVIAFGSFQLRKRKENKKGIIDEKHCKQRWRGTGIEWLASVPHIARLWVWIPSQERRKKQERLEGPKGMKLIKDREIWFKVKRRNWKKKITK